MKKIISIILSILIISSNIVIAETETVETGVNESVSVEASTEDKDEIADTNEAVDELPPADNEESDNNSELTEELPSGDNAENEEINTENNDTDFGEIIDTSNMSMNEIIDFILFNNKITPKIIVKSHSDTTFFQQNFDKPNNDERAFYSEKAKWLYEYIMENSTLIDEETYNKRERDFYYKDYSYYVFQEYKQYLYFYISLDADSDSNENYDSLGFSIKIENEVGCMNFGNDGMKEENFTIYFKTPDPQKIIDYLAEAPDKQITYSYLYDYTIDLKNSTVDGEKMTLVEKLNYQLKINQEVHKGIFVDISNPEETITVEMKIYENPSYIASKWLFVTLKGSKDEITLFNSYSNRDLNGLNGSLRLYNDYYYKDNKIYIKLYRERDSVFFFNFNVPNGNFTGGQISYSYEPVGERWNMGDNYIAFNILNLKYEYCLDIPIEDSRGNLYFMYYGGDTYREELAKKMNEGIERRRQLGIKDGSKIKAIIKKDLDVIPQNAPQWYNDLGENVTLMILGVERDILHSKRTYPMLCLKGTKGSIWFDLGESDPDDEGIQIIWRKAKPYVFGEIPKFDSENEILLSGDMNFSNTEAGRGILESIYLNIGDTTISYTADKLDIFGTDVVAEKFFRYKITVADDEYWEEYEEELKNEENNL